MPKCTFCGVDIPRGTGKMFAYNSGKIDYYCSKRCEKQLHKLKHAPLNVKWTMRYQKEHKKNSP